MLAQDTCASGFFLSLLFPSATEIVEIIAPVGVIGLLIQSRRGEGVVFGGRSGFGVVVIAQSVIEECDAYRRKIRR